MVFDRGILVFSQGRVDLRQHLAGLSVSVPRLPALYLPSILDFLQQTIMRFKVPLEHLEGIILFRVLVDFKVLNDGVYPAREYRSHAKEHSMGRLRIVIVVPIVPVYIGDNSLEHLLATGL
jgi:hypothetical protein